VQSRQARGIGSVFSLLLKDGGDAQAFARSLPIFVNAVSLGGIESLVSLPAHTTHGAYAQEHRDEFGVDDRLVRLAIGIEDVQDLIAALEVGVAPAVLGGLRVQVGDEVIDGTVETRMSDLSRSIG